MNSSGCRIILQPQIKHHLSRRYELKEIVLVNEQKFTIISIIQLYDIPGLVQRTQRRMISAVETEDASGDISRNCWYFIMMEGFLSVIRREYTSSLVIVTWKLQWSRRWVITKAREESPITVIYSLQLHIQYIHWEIEDITVDDESLHGWYLKWLMDSYAFLDCDL